MDEQSTRKSLLPFSIRPSHFTLLVLMALLLLVLNLYSVMYDKTAIIGSKSKWRRYPIPKFNHTMRQKVETRNLHWTDKLVQNGYQIHSFTPEERSEGTFLMKMIEWPKLPSSAVPFRNSSDPSHSRFVILNSAKTFYVGDQLQVMLQMRDFEGHPKRYGGDYLQARIHTPALKAGSAGTVIDNQNGFYYINFTLFWPGKVEVSVLLAHPSEGIQTLKRLREERLTRAYFKSIFKNGNIIETTQCNLYLPQTEPLCNYTDPRTGEPWFCYKPKKLPCSARISSTVAGFLTHLFIGEEKLYFQSRINLKQPILPSGTGYIMVEPSPQPAPGLGKCVRGQPVVSPSGFYYKDRWMSTTCNIYHFDTPAKMADCLRRKKVYLFGDSTMRQWFEYLTQSIPGLKTLDLGNPIKIGPHLAVNVENNIVVKFRPHGLPIQFDTFSRHLRYASNVLDEIRGGGNTVIAITLTAHFTPFPVEVYIRRIQIIRRSILQLLDRSPDTLVVIKTANVREQPPQIISSASDWYAYQFDSVMRKMFTGIKVVFVDAWEMTIAHYLPHHIHPGRIIIKNEVDVFLSHVCPSVK
ncbi:NXPE family member 3-like isoform X2 [Hemiscyllium ocellatum]|nr:NXPE family member 3-like isoform X2 [Hemiscyllium ocellatum]XP_060689629.1 NXPE family member 3-like isoform X2 [Hemiscyllium ocellatum]XP_060689630.1 NXPE family member 3-like isoform X2 [Hemiscyllium ocellatum]XP_060689631.1 NXPE family member 3-like isoform X2 [Hemiscyllium ocellatum]XP_060689632.1 NXPE family member 3-like isoform X2 [Hemiscyllium ocellatum]XP_060689633.1 NXPE family member 3-like isoform X2 [Hemiscyllium ocellatum]